MGNSLVLKPMTKTVRNIVASDPYILEREGSTEVRWASVLATILLHMCDQIFVQKSAQAR